MSNGNYIARYTEDLKHAQFQLDSIEAGCIFYNDAGVDVTENIRAREERTVETRTRLIERERTNRPDA